MQKELDAVNIGKQLVGFAYGAVVGLVSNFEIFGFPFPIKLG